MMANVTEKVFRRLLEAYGPQAWWPGESPLEVMLGAVLVQNTSWRNVERALENLRNANYFCVEKLAAVDREKLAELIRPAGYYRIKAKRLQRLMQFVENHYAGSIDAMHRAEPDALREQLLSVHGIGPETADSILLYALEKPVMVVDTYTLRVFARHGWVAHQANYAELQARLGSDLPREAAVYNELHALLVKVGQQHCRKKPLCDGCPLAPLLPNSGVCLPD